MRKRCYEKYEIKAISLDFEQAILQVCLVGGGYVMAGAWCVARGSGGSACTLSVRGVMENTQTGWEAETLGS